MTYRSRISVVIPVLNGGPYIRRAIQSVLQQTVQAAELVILDNASTDETPKVLDEFRDTENISIHRNDRTLRAAEQWSKAISLTSTPYFVVLAADDLLEPECLEKAERIIADWPEVDFVYGCYRRIDSAENDCGFGMIDDPGLLGRVSNSTFLDALINRGMYFMIAGTIVRRGLYDSLGGLDTRFDGAFDYDFFLRAGSAARIFGTDGILSAYRYHEAQESVRLFLTDTGDTQIFFEKSEGYDFLNSDQFKTLIGNMCHQQHQYFTRWFRIPVAKPEQIWQARTQASDKLKRWRTANRPQSRYVQVWPRKISRKLAWALGSTLIGCSLLKKINSLFRGASSQLFPFAGQVARQE